MMSRRVRLFVISVAARVSNHWGALRNLSAAKLNNSWKRPSPFSLVRAVLLYGTFLLIAVKRAPRCTQKKRLPERSADRIDRRRSTLREAERLEMCFRS